MLVWDIVWFPVGIVVDAITGAWYRIEPEQVTVTLSKVTAQIPGPDQIHIGVVGSGDSGIHIHSIEPVSVSVQSGE